MPAAKYRPYFTLAQLKHIQQCMLAVKQQGQVDQLTLKYINKYIHDIEANFRQPNHTNKPTLLERLGFSDSPANNPPSKEDELAALALLESQLGKE